MILRDERSLIKIAKNIVSFFHLDELLKEVFIHYHNIKTKVTVKALWKLIFSVSIIIDKKESFIKRTI